MAIIKPFRGIRPPKDLVEKVESRPYDVLDSEEARAEAGDNEMSLYHIIKPEIDFEPGTSEYDPKVYERAAENFQKFQDRGWLVQDDAEHYYIYAQTMNGKTQYGLVVGAHVDDYMKGNIKKHELTRRDKEEDRMKHVRVNNANIEPVSTTSMSSPASLPRCRRSISPTAITARRLPRSWGLRNRSRIPTIRATRSTTTSWQCASRPRNSPSSTTTVW